MIDFGVVMAESTLGRAEGFNCDWQCITGLTKDAQAFVQRGCWVVYEALLCVLLCGQCVHL